jgi:hypothetical protein
MKLRSGEKSGEGRGRAFKAWGHQAFSNGHTSMYVNKTINDDG